MITKFPFLAEFRIITYELVVKAFSTDKLIQQFFFSKTMIMIFASFPQYPH